VVTVTTTVDGGAVTGTDPVVELGIRRRHLLRDHVGW
jgi:hypothetical protein